MVWLWAIIIFIIVYPFILLLIKRMEWGSKISCEYGNNCCPNCNKPLQRISRKSFDRLIEEITFRIFDIKRYLCKDCMWEGIKWDK